MFESECLSPVEWETRNLGFKSFTLHDFFFDTFDKNKLIGEIENLVRQKEKIFVQIRLSKERLKFVPALQHLGFYYVETTLVPFSFLRKNKTLTEFCKNPDKFIPKIYHSDNVRFARVERTDRNIFNRIRSMARESFLNDRFHLDSNCPKRVADERFVHWVNDLMADGLTIFYVLLYKKKPIAFVIRKKENLILAGFGKAYRLSGFGDFLLLSTLKDMFKGRLTKAQTLISTNNTAVLNLYSRLGFIFKDPCVTLHYWKVPIV